MAFLMPTALTFTQGYYNTGILNCQQIFYKEEFTTEEYKRKKKREKRRKKRITSRQGVKLLYDRFSLNDELFLFSFFFLLFSFV